MQVVERPIDDMPQNMWFTVTLQPGQNASGELGKVVHGQTLEGGEHFVGNWLELQKHFD